MPRVVHYFDYKSPYAYLAQEETYRLVDELGVDLEWLPYTLDIPSFLGRAELDERGRDVVGERGEHQWRHVRYAYMDCRREARRRGLVIRGPLRIFDSAVAHAGFLFTRRSGDFRAYHDLVFERFWRRELDVGDPDAIADVLEEVGVDSASFRDFLDGEGRAAVDRIRDEAEQRGVFGVPSYLVGDELFWGNERLPQVRAAVKI